MAGFEGSDHVNQAGQPLDMVAVTGHADSIDADFARLAEHGLLCARESIGWRLAEPRGDGVYDWSRALRIAEAARRHGVQLIWTLMHYGVPPGTSLLDDALVERFAAFAAAAARALAPWHIGTPIFNPVNEISYLAWATCESNLMHPHVGNRDDPRYTGMPDGFDVKRRLVRAELAAIAAIRAADPRARFLHVDPLVHVVPPAGADDDLAAEALRFREFQWQTWDMLAGHLEPELGGHPEALDIVGVNHYDTAQWEFGSGRTLAWAGHGGAGDERRLPFSRLLDECWQRYQRPILIAETGQTDEHRGLWLDEIGREVAQALAAGVDIVGVCLYPVIGRPDWNKLDDWHSCGLWDAAPGHGIKPAGVPERIVDPPLAAALQRCRSRSAARHHNRNHSPTMNDLLVFSHLRWDFVFQRPQHLLTRLARHWRIVVVEEPVHDAGAPYLELRHAAPGIEVLRPHTPLASHGFADDQLGAIARLLPAALQVRDMTRPVVWFYTPMALPLLDGIAARAVVYDCMDELSAFRGAPLPMRMRESELLERADLVLTGGPSLYESKKDRNPNVLCLPSSVDARHFAPRPQAIDDDTVQRARALHAAIARPRLGYFGVIDERMDLELVAALADADPGWEIVMVGPVVKIDAGALPQRRNLHWLGQQSYELLPQLVHGWQVCLMPFALNESTRFISPTKTLEYLAAGKPVVSTAVRDVGVLYGDVVAIATDSAGFIAACRAALDETDAERLQRTQRSSATVARYSWDATAEQVQQALTQVLAPAAAAAAPAPKVAKVANDA